MTFIIPILLSILAGAPRHDAGKSKAPENTMEAKWGIQIRGIRLTAAGHMLDFRFRVDDPDKAAPLFERRTKPYLISQSSGDRLEVPRPPKVGPLRSSNPPMAGRVYWMFFGNPGKRVKAGDKVTVVIGEFKAENLTVE